jgi:hypothetical protein
MATQWFMEGPWFKNCNCDPGCPCDFNQFPTHDHCEGMVGMRINKGKFGGVDLSGLHWASVVRWPGAMHEGNGELQPIVDVKATDEQRTAIFEALSGRHGDTLMEIIAAVCPKVHPPIFAPFEFSFDLDARKGLLKAGAALVTEVNTLMTMGDNPQPYRVIVTIPNGFEYTGDTHSAETALALRIKSSGPVAFDLKNCHATMAHVKRGSHVGAKSVG